MVVRNGSLAPASTKANEVITIGDDDVDAYGATAVSEPVPAQRTIAVLPFVDMSPDGNASYLGDGLSEELSSDLAKIPAVPENQVKAMTQQLTETAVKPAPNSSRIPQ